MLAIPGVENRKLFIASKQNLTKGVLQGKSKRLKWLTYNKKENKTKSNLQPFTWHRCRQPRRNSHQETMTEHRQR